MNTTEGPELQELLAERKEYIYFRGGGGGEGFTHLHFVESQRSSNRKDKNPRITLADTSSVVNTACKITFDSKREGVGGATGGERMRGEAIHFGLCQIQIN